ncbi:GalNAc-alpha-(1-_4)-GalNAc-alpha-(1-_3)-diNAcBac-PP-undecaprenol alpha-1,4-N-acetyl-D-galactosaminyltransferase [Tepidimonas alkaliphilus]|uniref:GalNAc-alpha-(1->4)-GalNAc-alpha-(1->3)-diNAcBac-PP-undecaprenol alpha-1,4-N-acetyl-D-galactosaminyltransferase n=1 Tax=Tepidimonas alkaliphilus TaxID=2588942 RepID=A0A554W3R4_9BURK|nr:glycosyltransferase family 4 protein [Tepidimonas alkaliphilus]TSE18225.1 GalNAc-alpha-(1->4)-GalNAc-alpha-(1->3)-diNAcBac-PP-undecaprenol alpha-1,4-N-acetyl-D-galactosaminyltransferase [Tepidimonas alkaliphilus]
MNLLIFISSLSSGGAERVTANLATHWDGKGWQLTVVTLSDAESDFYQLPASVRRIGLGLLRESPNVGFGLVNALRRIVALRRVLQEIRPDVALAMMDKNNILLALAAAGLPGIVRIGSERTHPPQYPLGRMWEWLRRQTYRELDGVVALTEESAAWLRRHTSARRVPVIPNAVPYPLPTHAPYLEPPARSREGERLLLAVGRLVDEKRFDLLIAAFQELAARFPRWRLIILGEGPLRGVLMQQIAAAGLTERVALPGRAGNVGEWYAAADLYVMSSRFEGFPNTLAEAMAHGLPAVSFDCDTGPRDIIRHEVDGLLVPPGDVDALARALARLMADDALRQRYAARAVEVRERFSMGRIAGMWERLFMDLTQIKGRG